MISKKDVGTIKMTMDSEFKKLIRDKYILSTILMGCVEEFEGMDMSDHSVWISRTAWIS
jgi:hypothetical protein